MGRGKQGRLWYDAGGILSLANFITEHREAIEADLLRETGHEIDEIGRVISWGAFRSFLSSTQPQSRLMHELNPDMYVWSSTAKTNAILADIYDRLADLNANLIALGSGKKAKKPKYYPRPGDKEKEEKHIGSGALPLAEMNKWIEERRRERNG